MSHHEIQICIECGHPARAKRMMGAEGGKSILRSLEAEISSNDLEAQFRVRPVACLGNCKRKCRITIAGDQRWTWSLGGMRPGKDEGALIAFLRQWLASDTGLIPKAGRSKWLNDKALGRNPPLQGKS